MRKKKPRNVVVTSANLDLAKAIKHELEALNVSAQVVDTPKNANGDLFVLTEGAQPSEPVLKRHWNVLQSCKALRETETPVLVLSQVGGAEFSAVSGLSGLSRTLAQEWPDAAISTLEVTASSTAKHIARALLRPASETRIERSKSFAMRVSDLPLALPVRQSVPRSGNWLITGGARGVTASCTLEIAKQIGSGKFFLAGRSDIHEWPASIPDCDSLLPLRSALVQHAKQLGERPRLPDIDREARKLLAGREVRQTLAALDATGVEAHYIRLDISKRRSVQNALAKLIKTHGPITGLVHGAGVLADRQAIKKTKADLTKVFAPKVEGLLNVLNAVDVSTLTHCGLFSSAAAVFGNPGQSDYAMANAWLNNVAELLHATHTNLRVKSFCWGPWDGGMVDETLAAHFAERGINLIDLQDGAEIFTQHLLFGDTDKVNLLIGDRW